MFTFIKLIFDNLKILLNGITLFLGYQFFKLKQENKDLKKVNKKQKEIIEITTNIKPASLDDNLDRMRKGEL